MEPYSNMIEDAVRKAEESVGQYILHIWDFKDGILVLDGAGDAGAMYQEEIKNIIREVVPKVKFVEFVD